MSIRAWKEFAMLVQNGVDKNDAAWFVLVKNMPRCVDALEMQDV